MAHKTVEQLGHEIESFQEEIRKLQEELSALSRFTDPDKIKEKAREIKHAMGGIKSRAQERAGNVYEAVRHGGTAAVEKSRHGIGQKPVTAVLVAFAAGMLLSRLFGRHSG